LMEESDARDLLMNMTPQDFDEPESGSNLDRLLEFQRGQEANEDDPLRDLQESLRSRQP